MTIRVETKSGVAKLSIDGELTIYAARESKSQLLDALHGCGEMEIDLSGVSEMDTAGLQVLLLTKREAMRAGKTLCLVGKSPALLTMFNLYHLAGYFDDPVTTVPPGTVVPL